jgi:dolichol-phosphate mannosyltransferase
MPLYNEAATLPLLLQRVSAVPVEMQIVMVDDASTDGTREVLAAEAQARGDAVTVVLLPANGGKGAAIRAGLPHTVGEYVIIQDGDLEYDPADYVKLLAAAEETGAPVVYGTRFSQCWPAMRLPNKIVNWLLAAMVRTLYGARVTDEATCYKLFRREVLVSLPLVCRRFEFCPEVTAKALRRGHRIVEAPISYQARGFAEGKKIRWTDGVQAIWTLLRYRFWR